MRRFFPSAFIIAALALCAGCARAHDTAYYLEHSDERTTLLVRCWKSTDAWTGNVDCLNARRADAQAVAAEHGPPFHGHDAAWYRMHKTEAINEAGYCYMNRIESTDPDCAAAHAGGGAVF